MKIDLDQKIRLLENTATIRNDRGRVIETRECYDDGIGADMTLAQVCARGLINAPPPKGQEFSVDDKLKRFKLASALIDGGTQDISVDDLKLLKDCINAAYPQPPIVAQAHAMLEGDATQLDHHKKPATAEPH